ncbi:MAG: HD domain-containing phosphohydrolase [bacterium]
MPSNPRILVVDDERKICAMLAHALTRDGYDVDTCDDPADALEQVRARPYDLVITDLVMPGTDGFELIHQIKALHQDTFVLAMTGKTTVETSVAALQSGADDCVTKPLEIDALRRVVANSLDKQDLLVHAQELAAAQRPAAPQAQPQRPAARPATAQDLLDANHDLESRVKELAQLDERIQTLAGELRLDRLLEICLNVLSEATGARVVSILLADESHDALVVRARHGRNGERVVGERRGVGDGVAGWVAENRVPLLVGDVAKQPGFKALTRGEGYRSQSFIAVPLLHPDRLVGVACATDKTEGGAFDERDLRLALGLAPHMALAIENARLFEAVQGHTQRALLALVDSFEAKDGYARGHSARVADTATRAAREMGLDTGEIDTLRQAALLHDIGKLGVSDTIFARPQALSEQQYEAVKEHPARGESVLRAAGFLDGVAPLVRQHHERWGGGGYPDGLKGRAIDPLTRILTVADVYDAMTSDRPHREAHTPREAMAELEACAGEQFDPGVIEPFRHAVEGMS